MGCKPSKDAIRASATAQDDHGHNNHHIKQVDKNVIEDVVTEQKIISLKENEGENETAQEKLTSNKEQTAVVVPSSEEEEEKAALVIQSRFRTYKTKKNMAVEQQPSKAELEAEFSADDKELCKAATKIQASFRGHQVRAGKPVSGGGDGAEAGKTVEELSQNLEKMDPKTEEDELADIDLSDPELHKAATKIQASFRGHKVRKEDH